MKNPVVAILNRIESRILEKSAAKAAEIIAMDAELERLEKIHGPLPTN